jgi:hypothetical protein
MVAMGFGSLGGHSLIQPALTLPKPRRQQKIKLEKVENFGSWKDGRQLSTIHQHSTTTSPQKHHTQNTHFPKTPLKNAH